MTEADMLKFLEENKADIAADIRKKTVDAMTESIKWQLPDSVRKAVLEFFEAEIIPEIKKSLAAEKGPIITASIKASAEVGDLVAKAIMEKAVESMTGYRSSEVIKALFGVR